MSKRYIWKTGGIIKRKEDYFRDDDDLCSDCLALDAKNMIRILGLRRFGKTSFLMKLYRCLREDSKYKNSWIPFFVNLQANITSLQEHLSNLDHTLQELRQNPTVRALFLVDEVNACADYDAGPELQRMRVALVTDLVRYALFSDFNDRFRIIFAEASNMDKKIDSAPYENEIKLNIKQGVTYLMRALSDEERRKLLEKVHAIPYAQITEELKHFVGGHPLMVQYLGEFLDTSGGCLELLEFQRYLAMANSEADYNVIFDNLHPDEQFILNRMAHEDRTMPGKLFSFAGGAGGEVVRNRLHLFGLVKGKEIGGYQIGVVGLGDYVRKVKASPVEQGDDETIARWRRLFNDNHPEDTKSRRRPVPLILHHLADLHLMSSLENIDNHHTLACYGKKLEELANSAKGPHVIVLAGDLADQDPAGEKNKHLAIRIYKSRLKALRQFLYEKMNNFGQRLNSDVSPFIVVQGDTDAIVDNVHESEPFYIHCFDEFDEVFENFTSVNSLTAQYYRDWNVLVIPLNSAEPADDHDIKELGALRHSFVRNGTIDYDTLRLNEYGCLSEDRLKALKSTIENMRPKNDAGDFDHALRIAVMHHHLEQLTPNTTVDFRNVGRVKEVMAENEISILLHGHAHRSLLFSETMYLKGPQATERWAIHSICSGAMLDPDPERSPRHTTGRIPISFNEIRIIRKPASDEQITQVHRSCVDQPRYCFKIEVLPYNLDESDFKIGNVISFEVVR